MPVRFQLQCSAKIQRRQMEYSNQTKHCTQRGKQQLRGGSQHFTCVQTSLIDWLLEKKNHIFSIYFTSCLSVLLVTKLYLK